MAPHPSNFLLVRNPESRDTVKIESRFDMTAKKYSMWNLFAINLADSVPADSWPTVTPVGQVSSKYSVSNEIVKISWRYPHSLLLLTRWVSHQSPHNVIVTSDNVTVISIQCWPNYAWQRAYGLFAPLPFRPLDDSPPGLFAPWLVRGIIAIRPKKMRQVRGHAPWTIRLLACSPPYVVSLRYDHRNSMPSLLCSS